MTKHLARLCAPPLACAAVLLCAGPATAHVSISPDEGAAGSYAVLSVSVPHGCDGSPTTEVAIQMPEQIMAVTPTRHPLWEVRTVMQQLEEPVTDAHGNELTERVDRVVYSAEEPLPDGYRDVFELSLQLPDAAGETLAFPAVQTCEDGETAWVETTEDGDAEELDAPAPTVTVIAAEGDEHDSSEPEASQESSVDPASSEGDTGGATTPTVLAVAALVAGLLALAVGVLALVTARRRP